MKETGVNLAKDDQTCSKVEDKDIIPHPQEPESSASTSNILSATESFLTKGNKSPLASASSSPVRPPSFTESPSLQPPLPTNSGSSRRHRRNTSNTDNVSIGTNNSKNADDTISLSSGSTYTPKSRIVQNLSSSVAIGGTTSNPNTPGNRIRRPSFTKVMPMSSFMNTNSTHDKSIGSIDDTDRLDRSERSLGHIKTQISSTSNSSKNNPRQMYKSAGPSESIHSQRSFAKSPTQKVPLVKMEQMKAPRIKDPSVCNLFCAFYAEFDNIVGPKVSFQSPKHFMDHDIAISTTEMEDLLRRSFKCVKNPNEEDFAKDVVESKESLDSANDGQKQTVKIDTKDPSTGSAKDRKAEEMIDESAMDESKSKKRKPIEKPTVPVNSQSMFDSTCEYIITGNELTGQMISLSTHNVHILTRPCIIQDTRYERNALLFSIGFVIRRKADPSPFRPLLSRLATVFQAMEIESRFLSSSSTKPKVQQYLNMIVPSLNSPSAKCHLLLDDANALHLQYFSAPKEHAPTVPYYAVPVLLRPEYVLQSLDWDLTINWIVPYINGIRHAKLIAESSKVDQAIVLSCLRVLRHHNVLACVDIFRYSNIYESTEKAQQMLSGKQNDLLLHAFRFISKQNDAVSVHGNSMQSFTPSTMTPVNSFGGNRPPQITRVGNNSIGKGKMTLLAPISDPCSYPPVPGENEPTDNNAQESRSYQNTRGIYMGTSPSTSNFGTSPKHRSNSLGQSPQQNSPQFSFAKSASVNTHTANFNAPPKKEEKKMMKAIAILYASCQRGLSLSEVLTNRIEKQDIPTVVESKTKKKKKRRSKNRAASMGSSGSEDSKDIDWKDVFNYIDHRRFVTFGVIVGLIRRVHEYPVAVSSGKMEDISESKHSVKYADLETPVENKPRLYRESSFTRRASLAPAKRIGTSRILKRHNSLGLEETRRDMYRNKSALIFYKSPESPNDGSDRSLVKVKSDENLTKKFRQSFTVTPAKSILNTDGMLAKRIARAMNGTRCDDELCCMFQKSITELKELVKKHEKQDVISIYSTDV